MFGLNLGEGWCSLYTYGFVNLLLVAMFRRSEKDSTVRNYSKYSPRINNAAIEAEKRRKQNEGR